MSTIRADLQLTNSGGLEYVTADALGGVQDGSYPTTGGVLLGPMLSQPNIAIAEGGGSLNVCDYFKNGNVIYLPLAKNTALTADADLTAVKQGVYWLVVVQSGVTRWNLTFSNAFQFPDSETAPSSPYSNGADVYIMIPHPDSSVNKILCIKGPEFNNIGGATTTTTTSTTSGS